MKNTHRLNKYIVTFFITMSKHTVDIKLGSCNDLEVEVEYNYEAPDKGTLDTPGSPAEVYPVKVTWVNDEQGRVPLDMCTLEILGILKEIQTTLDHALEEEQIP